MFGRHRFNRVRYNGPLVLPVVPPVEPPRGGGPAKPTPRGFTFPMPVSRLEYDLHTGQRIGPG